MRRSDKEYGDTIQELTKPAKEQDTGFGRVKRGEPAYRSKEWFERRERDAERDRRERGE